MTQNCIFLLYRFVALDSTLDPYRLQWLIFFKFIFNFFITKFTVTVICIRIRIYGIFFYCLFQEGAVGIPFFGISHTKQTAQYGIK